MKSRYIWREFSVQDRETGSAFISVCVWYVSRGGTVYNLICQEYSLGDKEESLGVIPRLSLHVHKVMEKPVFLPTPTLSHSVSLRVLRTLGGQLQDWF